MARQWLLDSLPAVGLAAALAIVFVVDRNTPLSPESEVAAGDAKESSSLLGGKRRGPKPRADSVYSERDEENRADAAIRHGGSTLSEQAVNDGLDWLSRHQAQDGSWSSQNLARHDHPPGLCQSTACSGPGGQFDAAHTGLALLAFQGAGHFWFYEGKYPEQVKRGLDWLVKNQRQNGALAEGKHESMYEHAIATFALAEACATAKDSDQQVEPAYLQALERAVRYIEAAQHDQGGGWRYRPKEPGDTSVSGWVALALKTAREAGVQIKPECLEGCERFFASCKSPQDGRTGYTRPNDSHSEALTGVGMLVEHFLAKSPDGPFLNTSSARLAAYAKENWGGNTVGRPDYYLWYNCTLGMYLTGGPNWEAWNGVVRPQIERLQVKPKADGDSQGTNNCDRGSWPPIDTWSGSGGRIYSTALAVLTLEVYYRFAKKPHEN